MHFEYSLTMGLSFDRKQSLALNYKFIECVTLGKSEKQ